MITGSIGMLSSASLNEDQIRHVRASHGSAPDIAGKDPGKPDRDRSFRSYDASLFLRYG